MAIGVFVGNNLFKHIRIVKTDEISAIQTGIGTIADLSCGIRRLLTNGLFLEVLQSGFLPGAHLRQCVVTRMWL